jgi:hypothetical protein
LGVEEALFAAHATWARSELSRFRLGIGRKPVLPATDERSSGVPGVPVTAAVSRAIFA